MHYEIGNSREKKMQWANRQVSVNNLKNLQIKFKFLSTAHTKYLKKYIKITVQISKKIQKLFFLKNSTIKIWLLAKKYVISI